MTTTAAAHRWVGVHDGLHAHFGKPGYVEVSFFDVTEAEPKLREAGLQDHPEADGLLRWLSETPATLLAIGAIHEPDRAPTDV